MELARSLRLDIRALVPFVPHSTRRGIPATINVMASFLGTSSARKSYNFLNTIPTNLIPSKPSRLYRYAKAVRKVMQHVSK
jgi:hypothetical protein